MYKMSEEERLLILAKANGVKSYLSLLRIWILTKPPRWRFIAYRKWKEKEPKQEDEIKFYEELAKIQISVIKSQSHKEKEDTDDKVARQDV